MEMKPSNPLVKAILTDFYQVTMAYAYWKCQKHNEIACFDLFFRKNPFKGEFTLFCGLEECLKHILNMKFDKSDMEYLKTVLPHDVHPGFIDYLLNIDCSDITVTAIPEGSIIFPREPLITLEGPLAKLQILETTLLNLVNFASLVATNAARFRLVAGENVKLLEFGLRRAQGPDGGLSASRYCYVGGFDATSNILAGKMFDIPCKGTNAHSFITSFTSLKDLENLNVTVNRSSAHLEEFKKISLKYKTEVCNLLGVNASETIEGEFASFISYALTFPSAFLVLVDSYDVFNSGVPNFMAVALALMELGFHPVGVRIDSGDLAYQSIEIRKTFKNLASHYNLPKLAEMSIVGSNDICEETIASLNQQGHSLDALGVGTHLVTCKSQPALGCVFKLVRISDVDRIKLSEDPGKTTMPGKKSLYRLFGKEGHPLADIIQNCKEPAPSGKVLCRHPNNEVKRVYINPTEVVPLQRIYIKDGKLVECLPPIHEIKKRCETEIKSMRKDHVRALNPTPYKVSVSESMYELMHRMILEHTPIKEME